MIRGPLLAALLAMALVSGCLDGGGSDHPNKLAGILEDRDGAPAAGARVRLYRGEYRRSLDQGLEPSSATLVGEAHADQAGRFAFEDPGRGQFYVEALSPDSAAITILDSLGSEARGLNPGRARLEKAAIIRGRLVLPGSALALHLAGTHHAVRPDSAGAFLFPALPPGPALVAAQVGGESSTRNVFVRALHLDAGQAMDLDSVRLSGDSLPPDPDTSARLLLWDFETPDRRNLLRGRLFPDSLPLGDMTGSWDPYKSFSPWPEDPARGRFCLNMDLVEGEQGFWLAKGYVDLGKLQELAFFAKGKGTVTVRFRTALAKPGMGTFQAKVELDSAWRRHAIRPADILAPPGSGLAAEGHTFDTAKDQVTAIFFAKAAGVEGFFLDEIELVGPRLSDLVP